MSYAVVEDVAASWESFERFAADFERSKPEGLILHASGRTDEGIRIIEVWESEEAWHRFAEASEHSAGRFSLAPRHLRELRPTHLVIAGETACNDQRDTVSLEPQS
ncbi:MAG: hypothetical protein ACRDPX_14095 [Gaiellaceae bacterium]